MSHNDTAVTLSDQTVAPSEPDCPHWVPNALDLEPEQCFCLRCYEPLPCTAYNDVPIKQQKESIHV
jgi:hypothetical protein